MKLVLLFCAAFALGAAAGPGVKLVDVQQNMQPEEKPDESLAQMTGTFEKEEAVPVEEENGKTPRDGSQSRNSCPFGWEGYGSRCFTFVRTERTWIDAEKYCSLNGANLASVHTLGEYRFIQDLLKASGSPLVQAWIGGTDAVRNNLWFWSDGSQFNLLHWGNGQPNNADWNERCIEMNNSGDLRWNDARCEDKLASVCGTRP